MKSGLTYSAVNEWLVCEVPAAPDVERLKDRTSDGFTFCNNLSFSQNQRDDSKFFMRAEYMKNSMFFEQSSAAPEKSVRHTHTHIYSFSFSFTSYSLPPSISVFHPKDLLTVRGIPRVMERPIPIWVYVVSILIAIIIIALIIIALFLVSLSQL